MRVAFLGLGSMGMPMAANIARAGHALTVWNRSRKSLDGFTATVADSAADAVRSAEVVLSMLADDHAVEAVVAAGLLDVLPAGAVHVSVSTIGIDTAQRLTAQHRARGFDYVAAPVFGRPDMAAAQRLWVVAAGPSAAVERVRPVLQAVGRGITELDETPWHANLVKLGNNMMLGAMLETFGEVFALMRKADIAPDKFLEAANSLFGSPVYANYGAMVAERRHLPALFKAPLGLKDMRLGLAAADAFGVPMPLMGVARDSLLQLIAEGGAEQDWSALALTAQRRAGLR